MCLPATRARLKIETAMENLVRAAPECREESYAALLLPSKHDVAEQTELLTRVLASGRVQIA